MSLKAALSRGWQRDKEIAILRYPEDIGLTKVKSHDYKTRRSASMHSW